jgi:hypothetical protein
MGRGGAWRVKTVFFGPFVGELGWEMLYWHAWVHKVSVTNFKDYRKIVSSFPGREPFYPKADEFWPHPQHVLDLLKYPRGYITDFWLNGLPRGNSMIPGRRFGILPTHTWDFITPETTATDFEPVASRLLESYQASLPDDTVCFVPFQKNLYPQDNLTFGVEVSEQPLTDEEFVSHRIPFEQQLFKQLRPTPRGIRLLGKLVSKKQRLICIFPRYRHIRRPDKNWPREKYLHLVRYFQTHYPSMIVALAGLPGDAHFDDGVPEGCLDLINVPADARLDIQIAALQQSILSLGSESGTMLVSLATGCSALTWGWRNDGPLYHAENRLNTRFLYHPVIDASCEEIALLASSMIAEKIPSEDNMVSWDSERYLASHSLKWRLRFLSVRSQYVMEKLLDRLHRPASSVKRRLQALVS